MRRGRKSPRATHKNQSRTSRPRWDRGKDWNEKDGDEETETSHHRRKSSKPSFSDAGTAFDKGGDWRAAEKRADGDTDGIAAICDSRPREITILGVNNAAEFNHRVQRRGGIDDIHVEEGEECERELRPVGCDIPLENIQCVSYGLERDDLFEQVKPRLSFRGMWEVGNARPASNGLLVMCLDLGEWGILTAKKR